MKITEIFLFTFRKLRKQWLFNASSILILALTVLPFVFGSVLSTNIIMVSKATASNSGNEKALIIIESRGDSTLNTLPHEENNKLVDKSNDQIIEQYKSEGVQKSFEIKDVGFMTPPASANNNEQLYNFTFQMVLLPPEALGDDVLKSLSSNPQTLNILANGQDAIDAQKSGKNFKATKEYLDSLIGKEFKVRYNSAKAQGVENNDYPAEINVHYSGLGFIPIGMGKIGILQNDIDKVLLGKLPEQDIKNAFDLPIRKIGKVLVFDQVEQKVAFVKKYNLNNSLDSKEAGSPDGVADMVLPPLVLNILGFDLNTTSFLIDYFNLYSGYMIIVNILFILAFFIYDFIKNMSMYAYLMAIGTKWFDLVRLILARNMIITLLGLAISFILSFALVFYLEKFHDIYYRSVAQSVSNFNNIDQLNPFNLDYLYLGKNTLLYLGIMLFMSIFPIIGLATIKLKSRLN